MSKWLRLKTFIYLKPNLSLYSLYYPTDCNKLAGIVTSLRPRSTAHSKKCCSGGESLATLFDYERPKL